MNLSRDEIETHRRTFAENGYLVFKDVVPKDRLTHLRSRVLEEFEVSKKSGSLFDGGGTISGHLNCFPGEESRFAFEALRERGLIELLRELSPKSMIGPHTVGLNLNLPGSVEQHYHIDGMFKNDFLIANVAVVDTDLVNGAIDLLPGTNQRYYKYWQFALGRLERRTTRLPMSQGDVLLRTSTLWHRGMPNRSQTPRPMVAFTFGERADQPPEDPFAANGGKILFRENWYRPTLLGRLRERTFVAAPVTYAAYRFARSLVGTKGYDT
jgi:Phytanoyl-CoA dioxygenase (PhyH)